MCYNINMEDLKVTISKNIQTLRKNTGLTQIGLAERLNYSDKAVSKWERGESLPDIVVLKEIADLFGVSVDYLLSESHDLPEMALSTKKMIRKNRLIITLLATAMVWLFATIAFVVLGIAWPSLSKTWLAYVVAVPVSCIVLLVFNSIWGRAKYLFIIISVLLWSALTTLCLILNTANIWLVFVVGIPAQVMVILSSQFHLVRKNKKNA